jgi:adenylate cyclase
MVNKTEMIKRGGGRLITGTIIFVDIRGFTKLSEKAGGPSEVVDMLNDYFERVFPYHPNSQLVKCVFKYDGVVDKYIGDALMAVFGTLEDEKEAEFRAVGAALEFITAIAEMNEERARARLPKITIGVGVNTGELVAGFIGCSKRLEYTCIGDTVNTSSRICDVAEPNQVLISETTYEAVKDRIQVCVWIILMTRLLM